MRSTLLLGLLLFSAAASSHAAAPVVPQPDDPACTAEDRKFMLRALELVRDSVAENRHPFSAVLVKDGKILAEYQNTSDLTHDITQHAETGLISKFSPKIDRATLAGCTLYASSEPCTMCCGSIRFSGIRRVVYGVTETQFLLTWGYPISTHPLEIREIMARTAPDMQVLGPLMEAEGLKLHAEWAQHQPANHPSR
jgi:tRNA(Arg) A34 adenosine deaminase TadA